MDFAYAELRSHRPHQAKPAGLSHYRGRFKLTDSRLGESVPKILCLLIRARGAKPAGIMKSLSGTVGFVVLAVIAIVAVLSLRAFAQGSAKPAFEDKKFVLKIGRTPDEYVEVTDASKRAAFVKALRALPEKQYDIYFKDDNGRVEHYPPLPPKLSIKTDKVTTSEVAKNAPAGESAANDPHYTQRVTSDSPTEIEAVLDTFK